MKDIYIIGAGGFGREVAWLIERINSVNKEWNLKGFIDDDQLLHNTIESGYPVLGGLDYITNLQKDMWVCCAIANTEIRENIVDKFHNCQHVKWATLIDPSAILSQRVEIGEGTVICAGAIITVDIKIGKHVIINLDCIIGHDAILENFVTIYPSVNISGNVLIKEKSEIGTGTQIIQGKEIGKGTIVGAGTVVVKDLPGRCTVVGSPARVIKYHK